MTLRELLTDYIDGKIDAISVIRTMSGAFQPAMAVDLLAIICAITRVEQDDLEKETFREVYLK